MIIIFPSKIQTNRICNERKIAQRICIKVNGRNVKRVGTKVPFFQCPRPPLKAPKQFQQWPLLRAPTLFGRGCPQLSGSNVMINYRNSSNSWASTLIWQWDNSFYPLVTSSLPLSLLLSCSAHASSHGQMQTWREGTQALAGRGGDGVGELDCRAQHEERGWARDPSRYGGARAPTRVRCEGD